MRLRDEFQPKSPFTPAARAGPVCSSLPQRWAANRLSLPYPAPPDLVRLLTGLADKIRLAKVHQHALCAG